MDTWPRHSIHRTAGFKNYNKDDVVKDIIAINQDALLVPVGLTIPQFLAVYKTTTKLSLLPTPTVNCNFQDAIDRINGESSNPPPSPPANGEDALVIYKPSQEEIQDKEMINVLTIVEEEVAIGGQATLCRLITKTYIYSIVTPLEKFHAQLKRNAETKRIKAVFTSAGLTDTAECVANIICRKPPAQ